MNSALRGARSAIPGLVSFQSTATGAVLGTIPLRISRRFPLNSVPRIVSTWVRETGYYARTDRVPNPSEDDGIVFGERARLDVLAQVSRIVADPACAVN